MSHMTLMGQAGFDLYVTENGKTEYFYTDDNGNEIVVDKNKVEIETSLVPVQTTLSDKEIEEIRRKNLNITFSLFWLYLSKSVNVLTPFLCQASATVVM